MPEADGQGGPWQRGDRSSDNRDKGGPSQFGNGTTGLVMSLPVSAQGVSVTAIIAAVYCVTGKFGQGIDVNSCGSAFPAIAQPITTGVINRLSCERRRGLLADRYAP